MDDHRTLVPEKWRSGAKMEKRVWVGEEEACAQKNMGGDQSAVTKRNRILNSDAKKASPQKPFE